MSESMNRRFALASLSSAATVGLTSAAIPDAGKTGPLRSIDPSDFGARYDGVTDDSAALQSAINACATGGRWRDLFISGPMKVEKSVTIDRPVDKSLGVFRICGVSEGRIISGTKFIFDSSLENGNHPSSECVRIENLTMSGSGGSIFSGKFLRFQLVDSFVSGLSLINSDNYVQSVEVFRCKFVGNNTLPVLSAANAYDINFNSSQFERSGRVIDVREAANGVNINGNVFETCAAPVIKINGVNGLVFIGNYTEGNFGPTIYLGYNGGKSRGIAISGNNLKGIQGTSTEPFEIILGRCEAVFSAGNYCSGSLYDTSFIISGDLRSVGDNAAVKLFSTEICAEVFPEGVEGVPISVDMAHTNHLDPPVVSGSIFVASGSNSTVNSVTLPSDSNYFYARKIIIVNDGPRELSVLARNGTSLISENGTNLIKIGPGRARSVLEYAHRRWCAL